MRDWNMSNSTWIGSLDIDQFITAQQTRELSNLQTGRNAQLKPLNQQQLGVTTQLSMYSQLNSLLQSLQSNMNQVTTSFNPTYNVSSSNSNIATAQIIDQSSAVAGTHSLTVSALAQASVVASANGYGSSSSALNMTNTLTIQVGTNTSFNVSINSTDTLQSIASSINTNAAANGQSVKASIITNNSGNYQLVISSTQTGASNSLTLSESGTGANALGVAYVSGGTNTGVEMSKAQNAAYTFDTVSMSSATNTNIPLLGMNVNLVGTTGTPVYLTIGSSDQTASITNSVQNMITSYNNVLDFIQQSQAIITSRSTNTSQSSGMPQDSALSSIQAALQNATSVGSSAYKLLMDIGVSVQHSTVKNVTLSDGSQVQYHQEGMLQLNTSTSAGLQTLSSAIQSNLSNVQSILGGTSGIAPTISKMINTSGTIWKALYDSVYGAVPKDSALLTNTNNQIKTIQDNETAQENAVKLKYAALKVTMSNLQNTSIFIGESITLMSK